MKKKLLSILTAACLLVAAIIPAAAYQDAEWPVPIDRVESGYLYDSDNNHITVHLDSGRCYGKYEIMDMLQNICYTTNPPTGTVYEYRDPDGALVSDGITINSKYLMGFYPLDLQVSSGEFEHLVDGTLCPWGPGAGKAMAMVDLRYEFWDTENTTRTFVVFDIVID